jgi:hypothetical protein
MINTVKNTAHKPRLRRLAQKLGLPLPELVAGGHLPDQIAAQMEKSCAACQFPEKCEKNLAAHPGKIEKAPSFCANSRLLTFLARTLPHPP